jgi:RND family efflux transporter MFP subunit
LGVVALRTLKASKPEIQQQKPPVPVPMVRTIEVAIGPHVIHVKGEGTVRPLWEINLVPEVGGKVVYTSPSLVNGGMFSKGDLLVRIDPVDYQLAVTLARAKVKDAESRVKIAAEETAAAAEEWRLLHADEPLNKKTPPPLVAKEPQLAAAQAQLEAGRADLQKALLNLNRTELHAPFDGRSGEEHVDVGQYVATGQILGTLYSTEVAEITLPLEGEDLQWFDVPGFSSNENSGSPALVRARIAGQERTWPGTVVRTEGKLDERTRMIHVIVRVEEPYAVNPPLVFGLFVDVVIEGRTLPNVAVIPRVALHQNDVVWVLDKDGRLRFRKVTVARITGDTVIVAEGLNKGEMIVSTPLKAVTDGMAVRTVQVKEGRRS